MDKTIIHASVKDFLHQTLTCSRSGRISSEDQLVPMFILDTLSNVPGLPGLVAAGIFSSSLSAISANLNSLAAVAVQDYVQVRNSLVTGGDCFVIQSGTTHSAYIPILREKVKPMFEM